jgi:hypothetical protein
MIQDILKDIKVVTNSDNCIDKYDGVATMNETEKRGLIYL